MGLKNDGSPKNCDSEMCDLIFTRNRGGKKRYHTELQYLTLLSSAQFLYERQNRFVWLCCLPADILQKTG